MLSSTGGSGTAGATGAGQGSMICGSGPVALMAVSATMKGSETPEMPLSV